MWRVAETDLRQRSGAIVQTFEWARDRGMSVRQFAGSKEWTVGCWADGGQNEGLHMVETGTGGSG